MIHLTILENSVSLVQFDVEYDPEHESDHIDEIRHIKKTILFSTLLEASEAAGKLASNQEELVVRSEGKVLFYGHKGEVLHYAKDPDKAIALREKQSRDREAEIKKSEGERVALKKKTIEFVSSMLVGTKVSKVERRISPGFESNFNVPWNGKIFVFRAPNEYAFCAIDGSFKIGRNANERAAIPLWKGVAYKGLTKISAIAVDSSDIPADPYSGFVRYVDVYLDAQSATPGSNLSNYHPV